MKAKLLLSFFAFYIFLLLSHNVSCNEQDLKKEFGRKLGAYVEKSGIEFFRLAIKTANNFFDTVVRAASLTTNQVEEITQNKIELDELSNKIESGIGSDPKKFMEIVREFLTSKYMNLLRYEEPILKGYDQHQQKVVMEAKERAVDIMKESSMKFAMGIYDKWTELYATRTKAEIEKYPEYERINDMMQEVARTQGKGTVFLDAMRALIIFFDCEDWMFLITA